MAYGDTFYELLASGSTATSANTAHRLFGLYGGLSTLNAKDVVHVQVTALSGNSFRVGATNALTNNSGVPLYPSGSLYDLPPIQAGTASGFHVVNDGAGGNASMSWVVWRRGV
jgi:hypothetical protein